MLISMAETTKTKGRDSFDPWRVLSHPHLAEKSMGLVEAENKLVFMIKGDATKEKIKETVERGFNVKVLSVNVLRTRRGIKKAYVRLYPEYNASDIATRLGML